MANEETFTVRKAPYEDVGKDRVRIHYSRRNGAPRFTIFELKSGAKSHFACVLGHDEHADDVQMDIDTRLLLGVSPGQQIRLILTKADWWGQLSWYVKARDPAIRIPAVIAAVSFALGLLSLAVSLIPVLCSDV